MDEEMKRNIIESYDGDPEDFVFFQPPNTEDIVDEEDIEGEEDFEGEEDVIYERELVEEESEDAALVFEKLSPVQIKDTEPQEIYVRTEPESDLPVHTGGEMNSTVSMLRGEIDLNDPHYVNFKMDPYYDYGVGPEPKARNINANRDTSTLSIVSFVTGICSIFIMCCGFQYLLSISSFVTGIWCLCSKGNTTRTRVFAIIGMVCASLPILFVLVSICFGILGPILDSI